MIEETGIRSPSQKWPKTTGYYAAVVAFGLTMAALGPAVPSIAGQTNSDLSEVSLIFTVQSLGYFLGSLLAGWLLDQIVGHLLMVGGLMMMTTVVALIPLQSQLWAMILLIFVLGAAASLVNVGGNTLLVWVHREYIGPWMNGMHFIFGIGAFISPLIIVQSVTTTGGIAWGFWTLALLFLLPAGWLLFVPSPPIRKIPEEDQAAGINYYVFLPLILLFLIYVGAEASFNGWIFTYTITLFPGEVTVAGYLTSAYWGSLAVGRLLAIPISTRVGSWVMLLSSYLGCLLAIGLILVRPGSLMAVMVGTIGFGLSMASIFPTLLVFAERRMKVSGMVNGWLFGGAAVGGMIVPWFVGQLFELVGPQSVMITIQTILSIAFVILLIRR